MKPICPTCKRAHVIEHAAYLELARENAELNQLIAAKDAENNEAKSALESIAKNTCCDKCQEAALVARECLERISK